MYRAWIDDLVLKKDFKKIEARDRIKIVQAIRRKLVTKPKEFGKPLRGDLKGFWKLRVGDFRVIYEIAEGGILVTAVLIGFRRDEEVYRLALARIGSG